jgi:RNA polymerase sigma-70 factor (ECF subfamily)
VLILRDVLGFSGAEVADALGTTRASVYSALQRAHESVDHRLPERSQQATLRSLGDERLREIADRYVQAWERNDVDALAAMLTDGATLAMPPTASWFRGRGAVATGLRAVPLSGRLRWRLKPAHASGQLAARAYLWDDVGGTFVPRHLAVLTLRGALIDEIDAFIGPSVPLLGHHD